MITPATVQTCITSLLGWRNDSNPDVPQITEPTLLASDSGLYFNDFHPLLTIENISNAIPTTDDINDYLTTKVNSGIVKAINKVTVEKKLNESTKTILNSSRMFDGIGRFNNTIVSQGRFVGMEIELKKSYGVKMVIDRFGVQFSAPQTDLNIYVFHTSQVEPIQTFTITTTKSSSFEWVNLADPIDFEYLSNEYESGGLFYIGYFQDDINGQAIKSDLNWSTGPCATCIGTNRMKIWSERLNYARILPIYVESGNLNGNQMFDYQDRVYQVDSNFGMNFATTISCDISEYFCDNKFALTQLVGMQVAIDVLNDMKHSTRANRLADVTRNMIIRDLEGDRETFEVGMIERFANELKATTFDFSMIDSPCLPCDKKWGVRKRTL